METAKLWAANRKGNGNCTIWNKCFLFAHMSWIASCSHKACGHKLPSTSPWEETEETTTCPLQKVSRLYYLVGMKDLWLQKVSGFFFFLKLATELLNHPLWGEGDNNSQVKESLR
jgi:hypothetical protein